MLSMAVLFTLFRLFAPYAGKTAPSQEFNKYHHERRDAA